MTVEFANELYEKFSDEDPEVKVVEKGRWIAEHKYEHRTDIVEYRGKFYSIGQSRSGSYHSDYYYGAPTVQEVTRLEEVKVVVTWNPVAGEKEKAEVFD